MSLELVFKGYYFVHSVFVGNRWSHFGGCYFGFMIMVLEFIENKLTIDNMLIQCKYKIVGNNFLEKSLVDVKVI